MPCVVIDMRSPLPLYEQILDQIRARVRAGDLTPGAPLPSVQQLASDLAINPNTVAKAYLLLEREGIIQTVSRRGVFVAGNAPAQAGDWVERRLARSLEHVIEEARRLGLDQRQILAAFTRKLEGKPPRGGSRRGGRR